MIEIESPTVKISDQEYKAEFAKIDEVHLGYEDHGVYSVHIGWMMGSSHHGTGHYALSYRNEDGQQEAQQKTAQFIVRMMECFGDWDTIKGKECLALYPANGNYNSKALGLSPLPNRSGRPVIFSEVWDD